jgi:hypothetical protein
MCNTIGSPRRNTQDAEDLFQRNGTNLWATLPVRAFLSVESQFDTDGYDSQSKRAREAEERCSRMSARTGEQNRLAVRRAFSQAERFLIVGQPYSITATRQPHVVRKVAKNSSPQSPEERFQLAKTESWGQCCPRCAPA